MVAGTGLWMQGRGNDLQHSVLPAGIITGPDIWQDKSQQRPCRPGPEPGGWMLRCTCISLYQTGTINILQIQGQYYVRKPKMTPRGAGGNIGNFCKNELWQTSLYLPLSVYCLCPQSTSRAYQVQCTQQTTYSNFIIFFLQPQTKYNQVSGLALAKTQGFPKPSDITAQLKGSTKDPAKKGCLLFIIHERAQ